ncbi:hypothetical protein [Maritimibacter dapengensis]|uniref:Uncharacterized protein n=1 Tax=Maritimibacter dapengensis TaxID=2836868 RepID=A0ABS6T2B1_9RHOB|nr:hypothetical protein [Maritimibacter dapengensis]MBV7378828.1 hypothetical protein [Maritimibacter dapengensis]
MKDDRPYDSEWVLAALDDLRAFSNENRLPKTEAAVANALEAAVAEIVPIMRAGEEDAPEQAPVARRA